MCGHGSHVCHGNRGGRIIARLAGAEVADVKLALQNGSNYLPLIVMQSQKLVEKHLAAVR